MNWTTLKLWQSTPSITRIYDCIINHSYTTVTPHERHGDVSPRQLHCLFHSSVQLTSHLFIYSPLWVWGNHLKYVYIYSFAIKYLILLTSTQYITIHNSNSVEKDTLKWSTKSIAQLGYCTNTYIVHHRIPLQGTSDAQLCCLVVFWLNKLLNSQNSSMSMWRHWNMFRDWFCAGGDDLLSIR